MLKLNLSSGEQWDEAKNEFINIEECSLVLEHSLLSISKWEAKWKKPFLTDEKKTREETIDYIRCMTLNQKVDPKVYELLSVQNINEVNAYIEDPMTATTIYEREEGGKLRKETVTSELIYYWMIALEIPWECEKWHLNRLLTLVKVCNIKNTPPKKRSKSEIARSNALLNAERRKKLNSAG